MLTQHAHRSPRFRLALTFAATLALLALPNESYAQEKLNYSPVAYVSRVSATGGNTLLPFNAGACRYQQVYDASTFLPLGPMRIRELRFRSAQGVAFLNQRGGLVEYSLRIGLTPKGVGPGQVQKRFASNIENAKLVIARKKMVYGGSGPTLDSLEPFTMRIPFDTGQHFDYDPASGRHLCIEFRIYSSTGVMAFDFAKNVEYTLRGLSEPATTFVGCSSTSSRRVTWAHAQPQNLAIGQGVQFLLRYPKANVPLLVSFGARAQSLQLPGSCELSNDMLDIRAAVPSAGGGIYHISIPNDARLRGAVFFLQGFAIDTNGPLLDLSATEGIVNRIEIDRQKRTAPNLARIWALTSGNPDSVLQATGSSQDGLVTAFGH